MILFLIFNNVTMFDHVILLRLNQMLHALCLSYHVFSTEAAVLFGMSFVRLGHHNEWNCLASRWKIALSVFPKDTATRNRIGSRTKQLSHADDVISPHRLLRCLENHFTLSLSIWNIQRNRVICLVHQNFSNNCLFTNRTILLSGIFRRLCLL